MCILPLSQTTPERRSDRTYTLDAKTGNKKSIERIPLRPSPLTANESPALLFRLARRRRSPPPPHARMPPAIVARSDLFGERERFGSASHGQNRKIRRKHLLASSPRTLHSGGAFRLAERENHVVPAPVLRSARMPLPEPGAENRTRSNPPKRTGRKKRNATAHPTYRKNMQPGYSDAPRSAPRRPGSNPDTRSAVAKDRNPKMTG